MRASEKPGAVDDVGHPALDRIDEAKVFLRIVLQVGVLDDDDVPGRPEKSTPDRSAPLPRLVGWKSTLTTPR